MKWHNCTSCDSEFRVVSDNDSYIEFCPFCGESITDEDMDEDELEDEY